MNEIEIEIEVKKIIADQLGISESVVTLEKNLNTDLGADSLDTVELAMALEDRFGFEILDDSVKTMITVKNAVDYVIANRTVNIS